MSLIVCKADYIHSANEVFINLRENEEAFIDKVKVISYIKCQLLKNEELHSFNVDGIYVDVSGNSNDYYVYFDNYVLHLFVENKQIVDYEFR